MNLRIPELSQCVVQLCKTLDCSWVGGVQVVPQPHCRMWDCHNNSLYYTTWYGGTRLIGYYLLECMDSGRLVAILHSIIQKENQKLIDITPFDDNRTYNLFAVLKNQTPDYSQQEIWWDTQMNITQKTTGSRLGNSQVRLRPQQDGQ